MLSSQSTIAFSNGGAEDPPSQAEAASSRIHPLAPCAAPRRRRRLALYSHDAMGIGHMRRNLLIAQTLLESGSATDCMLIAGARQAAAFAMPSGIDCVTLPSLYKHANGRYCSQSLRMPLKRLLDLRSGIIRAALEAYRPDVFLVDKTPRGVAGELEPSLGALRESGRTRCVLGLREVLDSPSVVRREWRVASNEEAIAAFYDAVWIYGDPAIYDPIQEYGFSLEVASKARYTGYFDQRVRLRSAPWEDPLARLGLPPGRLALCMVGGGQDGESLASAFVEASLPRDVNAVLVTGPCMPLPVRRRLQRAAATAPRLRVVEFTPEPSALLSCAERVVIMGGYNTVTEALAFGKRALVVPRVAPRREQWIRAERLRDLGLIEVLHPDEVNAAAISEWLTRDLAPPAPVHERFDFAGLARLPELFDALFAPASRAALARQRFSFIGA